MTGIFVPKREINDELERHCDRIQKELEQQFDPGDPVQTRHGRPLWDAQVAIARDKLEVTMKLALGDAIDDIIASLDDGEFFEQAQFALGNTDEEETVPGIPGLSELCKPQR